MDVAQAIRVRRSIRSFQPKPIEEEKLDAVLEAARLAPSAKDAQEWKFVVVRDADKRQKLAAAAFNQQFVAEAPVVIVACALETEHVMPCGIHSYPIDLAIAVDHMTLQAVEKDLGSCWIGAFSQDQVKEVLGIPEEITVVALLPLGYPKHVPTPTPRKSRAEVICYDGWST